MEPIQINVTIKFDDATQAILSALLGGSAKPAIQPKPTAAPAPAKPEAPAKPAAPAKPEAPTKPAASAPAKPEAPAPAKSETAITIDSLRELAMTKMNAHRVEIKQKLTELGTPSITKLDAGKYQEMFDFLKNLS